MQPILDTGPLLWIDSTYSDYTYDSSTRKVSQINDLISTNHATQGTSARQPLRVNMGNVNGIKMDVATNQYFTIPNSIKTMLQSSFTITAIVQPYYIGAATRAIFGVVDTSFLYVWHTTADSFVFRLSNGTTSAIITTGDNKISTNFNINPVMVSAVFDSTVLGVGGLKLYLNTVLQADNGTDKGNTIGYNPALFNPPTYDFGMGVRNGASPVAPYGGIQQALMIHAGVMSAGDMAAIYNFYLAQS